MHISDSFTLYTTIPLLQAKSAMIKEDIWKGTLNAKFYLPHFHFIFVVLFLFLSALPCKCQKAWFLQHWNPVLLLQSGFLCLLQVWKNEDSTARDGNWSSTQTRRGKKGKENGDKGTKEKALST